MSEKINRVLGSLIKCKLAFNYIWFRIKVLLCSSMKETKQNVLIDLTGLSINRRIVQVVYQLINSGYCVSYIITPKCYINTYYSGLNDYQEYFFDHALYHKRGRNYQVVFCGKGRANIYEKRIVFCDKIESFEFKFDRLFYYPILYHPNYLFQDREKEALEERSQNKIKMLFVGNNSSIYSRFSDKIHKRYRIETRNEVIDYLLLHFNDCIYRPHSKDELFSALHDNSLVNKIVIVDKFRFEGDEYWNILKQTAFHVWTCGLLQPYCHNQVESMSCGTIPIYNRIIKYYGLNEQNSYPYNDLDGLASIVNSLLCVDINGELIKQKEKEIKNVYVENLSKAAFSKKINDYLESEKNEETYYICNGIYEE